mgnify:CR=1 FL=1
MRYLPLTKKDREEMLNIIGVNNVDELFSNIAEKTCLLYTSDAADES